MAPHAPCVGPVDGEFSAYPRELQQVCVALLPHEIANTDIP